MPRNMTEAEKNADPVYRLLEYEDQWIIGNRYIAGNDKFKDRRYFKTEAEARQEYKWYQVFQLEDEIIYIVFGEENPPAGPARLKALGEALISYADKRL